MHSSRAGDAPTETNIDLPPIAVAPVIQFQSNERSKKALPCR
jgi:hypothetical protein